MAINELVKKHHMALTKPECLPLAVDYIVRCLDPAEPSVRKSLLTASTKVLHVSLSGCVGIGDKWAIY